MDSRNPVADFDLAAEFCSLVGAPDLLAYLGLEAEQEAAAARTKLKARRRFMQGMQGNPKYKQEALFLIRHFAALDASLDDVQGYLEDARRRSESLHLPVLEMAVRGVLAGGPPTPEQEAYLRRNAVELGVSEATFERILKRATSDVALALLAADDGRPPDLYAMLGVAPAATPELLEAAYRARLIEIETFDPDHAEKRERLEVAHGILSDVASRKHYDDTMAQTGRPAPDNEPTPAPLTIERSPSPSAEATWEDLGPAHLVIDGDGFRPLRLQGRARGRKPALQDGFAITSFVVRNRGGEPMAGTVWADVGWLAVDPTRLDPDAREQEISVQVDPADVPPRATTAVVTVQTDAGEKAQLIYKIRRGPSLAWVAALGVGLILLASVGIGLLLGR